MTDPVHPIDSADPVDEPRYPRRYDEGTSHAHAVELLERSGLEPGLVLDIGCGHGPVAEPLTALGYTYVGLDVDQTALDDLTKRGFETHKLDLLVSESRLTKKLRDLVGDRTVGAILALDVLEHLVEPAVAVRSFATLAGDHPAAALVVSIPNVTHFDLAARLLLGRWDMTPTGLLDDTHLRFFSGEAFDRLFRPNGWHEADGHDTLALHSDQFGLLPTPALQPGAPLRNLLWRLRGDADPYAFTYQFVRRFALGVADELAAGGEPVDEATPFATVVVRVDTDADLAGLPTLLGDLAGQTDTDLEVVALAAPGLVGDTLAALEPFTDVPTLAAARVVEEVVPGFSNRNVGIEMARGRYLCFADGTDRVGPRWIEAFRRGTGDPDDPLRTDAVVRVDAATFEPTELEAGRATPFDDLVAGHEAIAPDGFDLLRPGPLGATALTAYAFPATATTTVGLRFEEAPLNASPTVFVARAVELCGLRGVSDLQVGVDVEAARPGALDLDPLRDALCTWPFLFNGGGFARFVEQRRAFEAATRDADRLRAELEDTRVQLADANEEREALQSHIGEIFRTRTFRVLRRARRFYTQLLELKRDR